MYIVAKFPPLTYFKLLDRDEDGGKIQSKRGNGHKVNHWQDSCDDIESRLF
jgi:hypothetical protein